MGMCDLPIAVGGVCLCAAMALISVIGIRWHWRYGFRLPRMKELSPLETRMSLIAVSLFVAGFVAIAVRAFLQ
jgi:hypothetical protein